VKSKDAIKSLENQIKEIGKLGEAANRAASMIPKMPSSLTTPSISMMNKFPSVKSQQYGTYKENIVENKQLIIEKRSRIKEIDSQLDRLGISEKFKWGLLSLIYFSIVGILLPTVLMPINQEMHMKFKFIVIFLFITGLISVFAYIFYELNYIKKK